MPELPEVETIRAALEPLLTGRRIERAELFDYRLTLPEPPEAVAQELAGGKRGAQRHRPTIGMSDQVNGSILAIDDVDDGPRFIG